MLGAEKRNFTFTFTFTGPVFKLQKKAVMALFSLVCHPLFLSSKILSFSNSLRILRLDLLLLLLILSTKFHLVAFITSSYSIHLLINIPQDRPIKAIYIYSEKENSLQYGLKSIRYLGAKNLEFLYLWNSVMLHRKYHLKHK